MDRSSINGSAHGPPGSFVDGVGAWDQPVEYQGIKSEQQLHSAYETSIPAFAAGTAGTAADGVKLDDQTPEEYAELQRLSQNYEPVVEVGGLHLPLETRALQHRQLTAKCRGL